MSRRRKLLRVIDSAAISVYLDPANWRENSSPRVDHHSNEYNMANRNHSSLFFTPDLPANTDSDYLQDPALWRDKLPQPFRMIDEAIQDLLMNVFDQIELRKVERHNRTHERVVPSASDATLMLSLLESDTIATVNGDGVEYAISAGSHGISVGK